MLRVIPPVFDSITRYVCEEKLETNHHISESNRETTLGKSYNRIPKASTKRE